MSDQILVSDDGPVRTIRINRADKRNALTGAMYHAMTQAMTGAASSGIRCLLIAGVPGAFSAGNDLSDFLKSEISTSPPGEPALEFLYALAQCECPIVAAVQGVAVGIGTTLLLHCDHVVAGTDARFSTPFVKLGLVPEGASSLLAPRLMGHSRAFSLLVMGEEFDAAQALSCGLINRIVAPEETDAEGLKAAQKIAMLPPEAVTLSRRLLRAPPAAIVERISDEAELFRARLASREAQEAFAAFLSRKP